MGLIARIDAWARHTPDRVAHRSAADAMTWRDLVRRSDALAAALPDALAEIDAAPDAPIVVRGHKETEMLVAFLGCAKAGRAYVPVDAGTPDARADAIARAAGAALALTPQRVRALETHGAGRAPPRITSSPDAPHYVMFTSGSTGEPKGVVITRACLETFLAWMLDEQRFAPAGEVFLNQALFSFDLSVMDTWCSLVTGGTLVSLTHDDVADFRRLFAALAHSDVTTWVSTPPFAQLCLAERAFDATMLPRARRFLFCGDVLPRDVARALLDRFPAAEVWNTYGPTEATVATTSVRIDRATIDRYAELPIGRPMPAARVDVLDERGEPVPDGERGEIVIAGPNVSPGYLGRPDLTARAFGTRDGMRAYRTGDWGSRRDGLLFFHGRRDRQVKLAGHRVEMGDVEANLRALAGVRGAAVVATAHAGHVDALHAFVVLAAPPPSERAAGNALRRELAARVPSYMLPRRFHVLDAMPLTPNGKTDYRALAELAAR